MVRISEGEMGHARLEAMSTGKTQAINEPGGVRGCKGTPAGTLFPLVTMRAVTRCRLGSNRPIQ